MFTTVIGKKCLKNPGCKLSGQMQDAGLPICPECAGELTPVTRVNQRAVIAAAIAGLLFTGASSVFGYGLFVQRFTAGQTVKWLTGHLKRVDRLDFGEDQWLTGNLMWWNSDGAARQDRAGYLYERVNSQHRFRPDFTADRDDRLRFELNPKMQHAYVVYRAPDDPVLLFSSSTGGASPATIRVPASQTQAIRLAGAPATEHFILVASRNAIPELEDMRDSRSKIPGPQIDRVIGELERDAANAVVYHVMIPHK